MRFQKPGRIIVYGFLGIVVICLGIYGILLSRQPEPVSTPPIPLPTQGTSFRYTFKKDGTVREFSHPDESNSAYWWLSSGGQMVILDGMGATLHGEQKPGSTLYARYRRSNAEHSDGGQHPQNIFRLLTRSTWKNSLQEVRVRIDAMNLSSTSDRDSSDGILLFSRYQDQRTVYYAGIRVDGAVVIKKKYQDVYTELAYQPFFDTQGKPYDWDTRPNIIPEDTWIGIRSVIQTLEDGRVRIELYVDPDGSKKWNLAAEAIDDGSMGGPVISLPGLGGLRTDYMDVTFDDYFIREL